MDLSAEVQEGLQVAGDTAVIEDCVFKSIIDTVCKNVCNNEHPMLPLAAFGRCLLRSRVTIYVVIKYI